MITSSLGRGRHEMNWKAYGGTYVYSSKPDDPATGINGTTNNSTFRDKVGNLPLGAGIVFDIKEDVYIWSEKINYSPSNDTSYSLQLSYGKDKTFQDEDIHVLRTLTFFDNLGGSEKGSSPHYIDIGLGMKKYLKDDFAVVSNCNYRHHGVNRGDGIGCDDSSCFINASGAGLGYKTTSCHIGVELNSI